MAMTGWTQTDEVHETDDDEDAPECDHKRHTAAFEDADCCYGCFMEATE